MEGACPPTGFAERTASIVNYFAGTAEDIEATLTDNGMSPKNESRIRERAAESPFAVRTYRPTPSKPSRQKKWTSRSSC